MVEIVRYWLQHAWGVLTELGASADDLIIVMTAMYRVWWVYWIWADANVFTWVSSSSQLWCLLIDFFFFCFFWFFMPYFGLAGSENPAWVTHSMATHFHNGIEPSQSLVEYCTRSQDRAWNIRTVAKSWNSHHGFGKMGTCYIWCLILFVVELWPSISYLAGIIWRYSRGAIIAE